MAYRESPSPWMSGNGVGCPGRPGLGCSADCLRTCPVARSGASGLGDTVWRVVGVRRADADGYNVDTKEVEEGWFSDKDTGRRSTEYWFASAGAPPGIGDDWNEFQSKATGGSGWQTTEVGISAGGEGPSTLSEVFGGISSIVGAAAPAAPGLIQSFRGRGREEERFSLQRREERRGGVGIGTILIGLGAAGAVGGAVYLATRKR